MRGAPRDLLSNYAQDVLDTERVTGDDTILTAVVTMVREVIHDDVALHQGDVDGSQVLIRSHYASTLLCNSWSRSCTSRAIWYSTFHSIKSAVSGTSPACQRRKNSSELS